MGPSAAADGLGARALRLAQASGPSAAARTGYCRTNLIGGGEGSVLVNDFWTPPPPINFVHDHLFFSKFIIIYFFVI